MRYYAHTKTDPNGDPLPESEWQSLDAHLNNVGEMAAEFAGAFGAEEWGRLAGRWHDLGKFSEAFQKYLRAASGVDVHNSDFAARTDHSTAGAQHAVDSIDVLGHLLAFVISGHHSGLLDSIASGTDLAARLIKTIPPWLERCRGFTDAPDLNAHPILSDAFSRKDGAFSVAFFTRMLYSCLVDADFLDTEAFMDPERSTSRFSWPDRILEVMEDALTAHVASFGPPQTPLNVARNGVRHSCMEASKLSAGFFSLTVPTGGGKTLASLAFALRHARTHGMNRVVYVIPFTSIIEQNADVFRHVFSGLTEKLGVDVVLEHHSNFDPEKETTQSRLATENWDAPLVITTSVQFYESLFSNRSSRCRKLHNLARSVIILDEAQALPVDFLAPCLRSLRELVNYGSSVVLCTATQPAVTLRDDFPIGLEGVREIVPAPAELYISLKRVTAKDLGEQSDDELSRRLVAESQSLCVVNTRGHARNLFEAISDTPGCFHLSAQMCPEHRSRKFAEISRRLDENKECRVVSTQLIEAGVDLDFPTVFRSQAGIDSIAQAAGRCNRNGRLAAGGTVYVFRSEHTRSERFFSDTAQVGAQVMQLYSDPLALESTEHYFRQYFWDQESRWDRKEICSSFKLGKDRTIPFLFQFKTVAESFNLIEDTGRQVIIPWRKEGKELVAELRESWGTPSRRLLRRLQRFSVQVPASTWNQHAGRDIELLHDQYPVLICPETHYSDQLGLVFDGDISALIGV